MSSGGLVVLVLIPWVVWCLLQVGEDLQALRHIDFASFHTV